MVNDGIAAGYLNGIITALSFFFNITLDRVGSLRLMSPVRVPRKLPSILSPKEVARLLNAATNPRDKTALAVAYGAGLRISEVVSIKLAKP